MYVCLFTTAMKNNNDENDVCRGLCLFGCIAFMFSVFIFTFLLFLRIKSDREVIMRVAVKSAWVQCWLTL